MNKNRKFAHSYYRIPPTWQLVWGVVFSGLISLLGIGLGVQFVLDEFVRARAFANSGVTVQADVIGLEHFVEDYGTDYFVTFKWRDITKRQPVRRWIYETVVVGGKIDVMYLPDQSETVRIVGTEGFNV